MKTKKIVTKTIGDQYYNEIKLSGHGVPRNIKTGEQIPFSVGKDYYIISLLNKEPLFVRCTQDCPYHLKINDAK